MTDTDDAIYLTKEIVRLRFNAPQIKFIKEILSNLRDEKALNEGLAKENDRLQKQVRP